jgi:hypothetical protein
VLREQPLVDLRRARQLAGEQPYLILPASVLAARVEA